MPTAHLLPCSCVEPSYPIRLLRSVANAVNLDAGEILLHSGHLADSVAAPEGNAQQVIIPMVIIWNLVKSYQK